MDIPGDEDPNSGQEPDETITASSASASVDSSGSGSEISSSTVDSSTSESSVSESTVSESTEENGAAEGTESSTSEEPEEGSEVSSVDGETDVEEKNSSLKNYEALYQDMLEVTENQNERWLPSSALPIRWTILTRTMKTSSRFPV